MHVFSARRLLEALQRRTETSYSVSLRSPTEQAAKRNGPDSKSLGQSSLKHCNALPRGTTVFPRSPFRDHGSIQTAEAISERIRHVSIGTDGVRVDGKDIYFAVVLRVQCSGSEAGRHIRLWDVKVWSPARCPCPRRSILGVLDIVNNNISGYENCKFQTRQISYLRH